jgi:3-dehydroquinate synthase
MNNKIVKLNLANRSYDIIIGRGLLAQSGKICKNLLPQPKTFIISDDKVAPLYLKILQDSLKSENIESEAIILPNGERSKSFANLEKILTEILSHKPERGVTLIALGGGVIGDITGFTASILLRGVNFIQIPTTLLAQVDSSVGGKTGINTAYGKNLVGSFYQPQAVIIDIDLLSSMSERDYKSGYAEVVKYGLINRPDFFDWLVEHEDEINNRDPEILKQAIADSCQSKADIVIQDERESGIRALLNLGHTFGHALESFCNYDNAIILHGEAVAIGMVMAFNLSVELGICSQNDLDKVKCHLRNTNLPVSVKDLRDDWDSQQLLQYMKQDKKVKDGKMVFILAKAIGESFVTKDVDEASVLSLLDSCIG